MTVRPTDHTTRLVRIGHIYVRSTAMRPNNIVNIMAKRISGSTADDMHGWIFEEVAYDR